jgi:hypothetical protein
MQAEVTDGRIMAPLRFVSEQLGFKLHWTPPGENHGKH